MRLRKLLAKESTGTAIGVLIFGWFAFEATVLGGETIVNAPYHPLGTPLAFQATAGETYGITIDRGKGEGSGALHRTRARSDSKRLRWRIEDADGGLVLTDQDPYRRNTRLVRFAPATTGPYRLIVERDNSGFFKRSDIGHITLLVSRDDRSLLRRWFPGVW